MKTILILFVSTFLLAQNPIAFSSLGDEIYNNLESIKRLKSIAEYEQHTLKINKYYADVLDVKKVGALLDKSKDTDLRIEYLNKLRELVKVNEYFLKMANSTFESSIKNLDTKVFNQIINSGLIDIEKNKHKILNFYNHNKDKVILNEPIESIIGKNTFKNKYEKDNYKINKQKEKIKRIRKKDRYEDELLEKQLQKELELKKDNILRYKNKEIRN